MRKMFVIFPLFLISSDYQMSQPGAGDPSHAMQEQSSHVASSPHFRVIFSGFFYQVTCEVMLYEEMFVIFPLFLISSDYQMSQPAAGDPSYAMQQQSSHVASSPHFRVILSVFRLLSNLISLELLCSFLTFLDV